MGTLELVFRAQPRGGELCKECLGSTTTSRAFDRVSWCWSPSFVHLATYSPTSPRLAVVNHVAKLQSSFLPCMEVPRFGKTFERLRRVEHGTIAWLQPGEEEASSPMEQSREALETTYFLESVSSTPPPLGRDRADDLSLNNPLLRQHRLGCGWFAVVMEWEGVIVEDDPELERRAWTALAEEESKSPPPAYMLRKAEGMKNEQAISEVFAWSRDYKQMKRLAMRKEELFEEMQGGVYKLRPGSKKFLRTLKMHKVPVAMASTRPMMYLERAIKALGMEGFFDVVLAAEDVQRGKPDPELYLYAAEQLGFMKAPERCMVFGNSNSSIEAAHDGRMKCVAVAGKHPIYELGAGDLVVRRLDELSIVDLKNLSNLDSPEFHVPELQLEMEMEVQEEKTLPRVATKDW